MPPRRLSRHTYTFGITDDQGRLYLTDREPFTFRVLEDTKQVRVRAGDTLHSIAGREFKGFPRPAGLWWVIADFQPEPIHDPTIALVPGQVLFVPSVRAVEELIFSEERREEL